MRSMLKMTWVETKLFVREPMTVIFVLAFPILTVIILGKAFTSTPANDPAFRGVRAIDYYAPGYIAITIAAIGLIALPVHLASYRERGVLRRLRASGAPVSGFLGSQVLVSLGMATVGAVLVFVAATGLFDAHRPASAGAVAVAFLESLLAFAAIGILLGSVMPSARAAQGTGLMLFFVMMFLAGTAPPRQILGEALRRVGDLLPLTHAFTAVQDPWIGRGANPFELLVVAGMFVAAGGLSLRTLRFQ